MRPKTRIKVIRCPVQNRLTEVSYKIIGNLFNREYVIQSCPAMQDWGGCDRQCKNQLAITRQPEELYPQ